MQRKTKFMQKLVLEKKQNNKPCEVCDGKLQNYIMPLKQIIFFRLMKQLSEVAIAMLSP